LQSTRDVAKQTLLKLSKHCKALKMVLQTTRDGDDFETGDVEVRILSKDLSARLVNFSDHFEGF
jgi:hypothetical protein